MTGSGLDSMILEGFRALATVGAPIFGTLLAVGLGVGILQSATQINDPSVGFVPKLTAAIVLFAALGSWALARFADLVRVAFDHVAQGG